MLRDYPFNLDSSVMRPVFDQFGLNGTPDGTNVTLLEFKILTPDSFIWKFLIADRIYYLYAEDYIQSLDAVRASIQRATKDNSDFKFIKVNRLGTFEDSSPVRSASVYEQPRDYENWKHYAAESGFDFVFLVASNEDAADAYFDK